VKKVLITGIAGGLGRLLARRLLADCAVCGVDTAPWDHRPPEVPVYRADLRKREFEDVVRTERPTSVVHLGFVRVVSVARGGDPTSVEIPQGFPVAGADLLVVEDILDTGKTLAALRHRLEALGPSRLRIAVLLDKPSRRSHQVDVDFSGFTVEDRCVVGYGLDWKGLHRNLPYISFVDTN
jgi:hypoxanthine phosphoribosyltransferase